MQHLQKIGGGCQGSPGRKSFRVRTFHFRTVSFISFHFFILHTLLCNGISSVLLESIPCALFPSRRGATPFLPPTLPPGHSFSPSLTSPLSPTPSLTPPPLFPPHRPLP